MFDFAPMEPRDEPLSLARCLFFDHGHELADAAAMLGGASAEARVISCALLLQDTECMTPSIRRDLVSLYRLLSLDRVDNLECLESALFAEIDPGCREVETICLMTDSLADILAAIDASHDAPKAVATVNHTAVA